MKTTQAHISKLKVSLRWSPDECMPIGHLLQTKSGAVLFEYLSDFLKANIPLSPFKLNNIRGIQEAHTEGHPFYSLFGVFADSLPDGWGFLIMARAMRQLGLSFENATVLDKLAFIGSRGMGALIYEPSTDSKNENDFNVDLCSLSDESQKILKGASNEVLNELLILGGSPGGARPKILVAIEKDKIEGDFFKGQIISGHHNIIPNNHEPWLIKFHTKEDNQESAFIELLYSKTASMVGIEIEPTALFEDRKKRIWFGMRRFDCGPNNSRLHLHSLAGLLHADFRLPSLDYETVLKATYLLTRSAVEVEKAFRLAVFNAIFHNRDDHSKNFSFLMNKQGQWKLAPAYDLTYSMGPGGEHTTSYMLEGKNPGAPHFLALAKGVGITEKRAREIIMEVDNGRDYLANKAKELKLKSLIKAPLFKLKYL